MQGFPLALNYLHFLCIHSSPRILSFSSARFNLLLFYLSITGSDSLMDTISSCWSRKDSYGPGKWRTFPSENHDFEDKVSGQSLSLEPGLSEIYHFFMCSYLKEDGQVHKKGQNKPTSALRAQTQKDGLQELMEDALADEALSRSAFVTMFQHPESPRAGVYTKDKNEIHCWILCPLFSHHLWDMVSYR